MKDWIKFRDKEPKDGQIILITDTEDMSLAKYRGKPVWRKGDPDFTPIGWSGYDWEWDVDTKSLTHWMPAPALPEKEEV